MTGHADGERAVDVITLIIAKLVILSATLNIMVWIGGKSDG